MLAMNVGDSRRAGSSSSGSTPSVQPIGCPSCTIWRGSNLSLHLAPRLIRVVQFRAAVAFPAHGTHLQGS